MQNNMITPLIKEYNNMIDSLTDDFKKYNKDEETLAFIIQRTENFIDSTRLALNQIIIPVLEKDKDKNYEKEIKELKIESDDIFKKMEEITSNTLIHEEEEEHIHDHHHHHHHLNMDIEEVQDEIQQLTNYLMQLKELLQNIS